MDPQPTARLLIAALRAFEHALQERLHADGYEDVSLAQTNVLRHLDPEGMRITDFARDAGVSKQAISQAIRGLVDRDLVEVRPDPDDGRARVVHHTDRGRAMVACAIDHVRALEVAWSAHLGTEAYEAMRSALGASVSMFDDGR